MKRRKSRQLLIASVLAPAVIALCVCGCADNSTGTGEGAADAAPEKHFIACDESMDSAGDGHGASALGGALDDPDSGYYVINDYYNMKSGGGLHILSGFETFQQTTEYTCGPAAALMVLNHYGNHDYNELGICRLTGTDDEKGTSVEGLAGFFEGIGWKVESNAQTEPRFGDISDAEEFIIRKIDEGTPVMVDWEDWRGHWQVIAGIDTCGNNSPYDDVVIMADPYDVTDHYQDGYYTVPFGRFFDMWREGPCAQKADPYEQPYVIAVPE